MSSIDKLPYFSCILARDSKNGGIGYQNKLPWVLKDDMDEFRRITLTNSANKENIVIMGKNTWESIGRPLPNRINIIVSKTINRQDLPEDVSVVSTLTEALIKAKSFGINRYIFVIGGVGLYKESFKHPSLESIYLTEVCFTEETKYDIFFNDSLPKNFMVENSRAVIKDGCTLTFSKWNRYSRDRMNDEELYIGLLNRVLTEGEKRDDRTGVGTISLFGPQIEFDISKSFPLITTKRVSFRLIFEELMWFLRGQTQNNILNDKNVHIWDGNSSPEYMEKVGLSHYPKGELGPIYGAQWRNFGGEHKFETTNHISDGNGIDQIADVIHQIKTNPTSRRIVVSAWNPKDLKKMALQPCHVMWQMYVREKKFIDCKITIRSNDLFLGAPFNIASYALLTYMISDMTGYTPGRLIYSIGDAHIYNNHIEQVNEQLSRHIRPFPKLTILKSHDKIEDFKLEDFKLDEYEPHPTISGEMAV